jgi:thiamine pyrophosphate-dependent acetolactate synthase large subunit-like protein
MELWVRDGEKSVKIQGSLKAVYEELLNRFKESPQILAFNGTKRERRRFKKELRQANRDLLKAAQNYLNWYKNCKRLFS